MFAGIKQRLQDVRYGDMRRKKRWLITLTVLSVVVILLFWFFFGAQRAVSQNSTESSEALSFSDLWKSIGDSMSNIGSAFTASMTILRNIQTESAATTSSSTDPMPTPPESQ